MSGDQFSAAKDKVAKISIGSLEPGHKDKTVEAQYNPKELEIAKSVPWSKVNDADKGNSKSVQKEQGIHLEFTGVEGRSISVELLFDGYEQGDAGSKEVVAKVKTLEALASVIDPSQKKEDMRRPHRCVVAWGTTLEHFTCVIESLSTKYTMFSASGKPLRATCVVKLKEADTVSTAKKKK
jgi:hypothetical protein